MEFLLQNKGSLLLALGVGLLTFFVMRSWSRHLRTSLAKERGQPLFPRRTREEKPLQPLIDAPVEVTRWQVEMHDLARDLQGQLDTKIAILQRLTIDAHAAAERLEALLARVERSNNDQIPNPNDQ